MENIKFNIKYFANIYQNRYFKCIEFFNTNETMIFGITLYKKNNYVQYFTKYLLSDNYLDYNNLLYLNNNDFDPLFQTNEFNILKNNSFNILSLKRLFLNFPKFSIKSDSSKKYNKWYFKNIFSNCFCFCKYSKLSECLFKHIKQKCKYYLYLNIIDNNSNLYKKSEYLLADFFNEDTAPSDAYLIFKEMINQKLNAHFMTKREDIYNQYINHNNSYLNFPIIYDNYYINGNFLEKYLDLLLRLKVVISGAIIYSFNNLFYNIEYITYICLGHGVSYLKDFLYKDYYSNKIYNKIVLPPSQIIILNAKKYGWKNNDIIPIGLPRWDILINYEKSFLNNNKSNFNQSIFIMFTWRDLKENQNISKYYLKNILNLLNDKLLNNILIKKNINLYFCLHHMIEKYKYLFKINRFIKYINQEQIIDCLTKSSLIITDFSSIIFDIMAKKKPYIIFIPDSEDQNISYIYTEMYCNIINSLKNGTINFKNRFFKVSDTVKKIIYYINHNFVLESKMEKFYSKFNLIGGNNTKDMINYLKYLN